MRLFDSWFSITVKEDGIFKTVYHRTKDKERAERWGEQTYGKIYGVAKVDRDVLYKLKEKEHESIIRNQQPLGMKITRTVYETDFDLTEMLLGKPKIDIKARERDKEKDFKKRQLGENVY